MWAFVLPVFALTAAFCALALKKTAPEVSAVLAVAAGGALLLRALSGISPLIGFLRTLTEASGLNPSYSAILLKTIGICFVCQFTADACRDAGQSSLASKVELASKLSVLLLALPLFESILGTVRQILSAG